MATALLETPRFANSLRSQVVKAFGELDYDASQLPFRIARNASVIETHFPRPVGVLAANPHVFLAWAEKLEAVVNESMTTDEKLRFHLASAIRNQIQGGTNLDAATLDNLIARAPLELRQRAFETALTQCPRLSGGERASVELEFIILKPLICAGGGYLSTSGLSWSVPASGTTIMLYRRPLLSIHNAPSDGVVSLMMRWFGLRTFLASFSV